VTTMWLNLICIQMAMTSYCMICSRNFSSNFGVFKFFIITYCLQFSLPVKAIKSSTKAGILQQGKPLLGMSALMKANYSHTNGYDRL